LIVHFVQGIKKNLGRNILTDESRSADLKISKKCIINLLTIHYHTPFIQIELRMQLQVLLMQHQ